jgi:site-specific DNA-methyltransferase (cytosine-N4-specific)
VDTTTAESRPWCSPSPTTDARPGTGRRTPSPARRSSSPSRTSTTSRRTSTPRTSAPTASDATSRTTGTTTPRAELDPLEAGSAPIVLAGDCRDVLPTIPTGSVDAVVTSPPYLKQRAYGQDTAHELGLEETVAEYVRNLADVFDELRRVLRPTGFAWLNIGDKANNSGGAGGDWTSSAELVKLSGGPGRFRDPAFPEGSFVDVPGQVVAELLRRGWRLRLPIVWDKGRESPESLRHIGRPRWSHEMIYLLSPMPRPRSAGARRPRFFPSALAETGSVWHFPPGGNGDPHLAPFPDELARRCILPTTLPGDVVLDPFSGSGTVPRVAHELGRRGVGIELYADRPELLHKATTRKDADS